MLIQYIFWNILLLFLILNIPVLIFSGLSMYVEVEAAEVYDALHVNGKRHCEAIPICDLVDRASLRFISREL